VSYVKGTIGNKTDAVQGLTDLKAARFGVFGYFTGKKNYREADYTWATGSTWKATSTEKYPNFFYNQELIFDDITGKNAWVYEPVKYWPNGVDKANDDTNTNVDNTPSNTATELAAYQSQKLSFFAFAPFTTTPSTAYDATADGTIPSKITNDDYVKRNGETSGVNAFTTNESPTDVWVKYLMPNATATEAVDLLWGLAGKDAYKETDAENPAKVIGSDYNENLTKQIVPERVKFLFKHALAKLGGATANGDETDLGNPKQCGLMVVADVDTNSDAPETEGQSKQGATYFPTDFDNTKTLITLKSVKVQDGESAGDDGAVPVADTEISKLFKFGWFDIETGEWCDETGTYGPTTTTGATYNVTATSEDADVNNTTYTINALVREPKSTFDKKTLLNTTDKKTWTGTGTADNSPVGVKLQPQPVFANENVPAMLFIPTGGSGTTNQKFYITVDYLVRTADPNLRQGYSEVEQVITNEVIIDGSKFDPNKYYTIIMHLGMTSVKFEARVTDWSTNQEDKYKEDGTIDNQGEEWTDVVWLPSNVVTNNIVVSLANKNFFPNLGDKETVVTVKANGSESEITDYSTAFDFPNLSTECDWLEYDKDNHKLKTKSGADNSTGTDRTATITAVYKYKTTGTPATETTLQQKIKVTQYGAVALNVTAAPGKGKDGNFKVDGDKRALTATLKGGAPLVLATANVKIPGGATWLTWDDTEKKLVADDNRGNTTTRNADVTVEYTDAVYGKCTGTVNVVQDAAKLAATISPLTLGSAANQTATLAVTLNGAAITADQYDIIDVVFSDYSDSGNWLKYNRAAKTIETTEANTGTARTAKVTVKLGALSTEEFTVTQSAPVP